MLISRSSRLDDYHSKTSQTILVEVAQVHLSSYPCLVCLINSFPLEKMKSTAVRIFIVYSRIKKCFRIGKVVEDSV